MSGGESRRNQYFVPGDGISREVIQADLCKYLDHDASVWPGDYQGRKGYYIKAYRNLTTEMIKDLQADSARWETEKAERLRSRGSKSNRPPQQTDLYENSEAQKVSVRRAEVRAGNYPTDSPPPGGPQIGQGPRQPPPQMDYGQGPQQPGYNQQYQYPNQPQQYQQPQHYGQQAAYGVDQQYGDRYPVPGQGYDQQPFSQQGYQNDPYGYPPQQQQGGGRGVHQQQQQYPQGGQQQRPYDGYDQPDLRADTRGSEPRDRGTDPRGYYDQRTGSYQQQQQQQQPYQAPDRSKQSHSGQGRR